MLRKEGGSTFLVYFHSKLNFCTIPNSTGVGVVDSFNRMKKVMHAKTEIPISC